MSKKVIVKLTPEQLEQKAQFINEYMKANNAADGSSVDSNANVSCKNVATLMAEMHKDINVQIKRYLVSQKIKELFGEDLAKEYNRQIENHLIYVHDESHIAFPYCVSISMYPFLLNGLKDLGGESKKPEHLVSYCGNFVNLVYAISSQFAGAVATVEFLMYFDYFARKDFGDDYLQTHAGYIANCFQQVVYSLNQPASARGFQSVFWNISIFDKPYFESLFGEFRFPDCSAPKYETLSKLQEFFMTWFNQERTKAILTFPVVTAAILTKDGVPVDEDFEDMCASQDTAGNSFFKYESSEVDSLASCCFAGNQKVLVRTNKSGDVRFQRFDELGLTNDGPNRKNFSIFHNGSWVNGKLISLPNRDVYKITTVNNKTIFVSDNHLNPCLKGDVVTTDLTTDDYLLFNTRALDSFPEQDLGLTYEQGYAVGAFLGDGSFGKRTQNGIYEITFSLNKTSKLQRSLENFKKVLLQFDSEANVNAHVQPDQELVSVRISCKKLVDFIQLWTNWSEGTYSFNKKLNLSCLLQSLEFRKGILAGWYDTDGGNSNRCYTTSPELAENMEVLITSLGLNSIINKSDRTGEVAFEENGKQYIRKYPLYCVRWYNPKNKRSMKDVYIVKNNSIYFRINSIEKVEYKKDIYCFEMDNQDEPYFTLPNGIITHNCRLRNELQDNTFSYSLGAGGVSTGSLNVITLNANRFVQDCVSDLKILKQQFTQEEKNEYIKSRLNEEIKMLHKFQMATKAYLEEYLKNKMLPVYDAGYINMSKQFLTIGLNGLVEAAEFMGYEIGNNKEYKNFTSEFLKVIYFANQEGRQQYKTMFNTEFVPAENLGVKNYNWDKEDGYVVNPKRNCYNSYMYAVEDEETTPLDKFIIHGKDNLQYLDGGSSVHLNLEEYPTKEGYKKLYRAAAKTGCNYWTTNVKITCCEDCGYIDKHTLQKCPKCGSKNVSWATRIIGYLQKLSSFSSERQKEADLRYYHKSKL